jgi:3-phenylpropionate/cinnamic acid dioxygenase small subunit
MGAGTWESYHAITSLMFRYAECVDRADFEGLGQLFEHGQIRSSAAADSENGMRGARIGKFYAETNRVHEDGTLRTRHLCTNLLVDIDEGAGAATARSYYVVLQATPKLPFQPIVGGRYEDRFERRGSQWYFLDRLIHVDQIGDVSEHLSFDLTPGDVRPEKALKRGRKRS